MTISRRDILKGISLGAGSLVLSPMLSRLSAEAAGAAQKPKRFVFVLEGNGLPPDQIQPVGIERRKNAQSRNDVDKLQDTSLKDHSLPPALEPLHEFKKRLTIIQGLSGRIAGGGHSNNFGALGAYNCKGGVGSSGQALGETVDGALAKTLGGIFPHLGLGISDRNEHSVIYNCSAWDAGKKLPTQCQPALAYSTLFGSVAQGDARREFTAKQNLLDSMIDDVRRLENRLAGPERAKLQSYTHAFEAMKNRQSRLNEINGTLREHAPVVSDKFTSGVEADRLDAQFDIAAAALIAGLTNVVTLASGVGNPYFSVRWDGLGISLDKHSIGHGKGFGGKSASELMVVIRRFHMELIARLATKLQAMPEGDGTMLDNTVIVYLSDAAEGHHSRCWEWPFVVLGDLGGSLRAGNRYLCYPKYGAPGHRTVANLYTTFLRAAGAPRESFGIADPELRHLDQTGPLVELA